MALVHIPIGLLVLAPVLLLAGMLPGRWREGLRLSALLLLVVGTAAAYVAKESGEAAAALADRTPQINAVLMQHEQGAEAVLIIFTTATLLYAAFVGSALVLKPIGRAAISIPVQLAILGVVLYGTLAIANTGHLGGRLVHELGLRAMM